MLLSVRPRQLTDVPMMDEVTFCACSRAPKSFDTIITTADTSVYIYIHVRDFVCIYMASSGMLRSIT